MPHTDKSSHEDGCEFRLGCLFAVLNNLFNIYITLMFVIQITMSMLGHCWLSDKKGVFGMYSIFQYSAKYKQFITFAAS